MQARERETAGGSLLLSTLKGLFWTGILKGYGREKYKGTCTGAS